MLKGCEQSNNAAPNTHSGVWKWHWLRLFIPAEWPCKLKGWLNIWANSRLAIVPTAMRGHTHCQHQCRLFGDSRGRRRQVLEVEVEVSGSVVDFMEATDSSKRSIGLMNMAPPLRLPQKQKLKHNIDIMEASWQEDVNRGLNKLFSTVAPMISHVWLLHCRLGLK